MTGSTSGGFSFGCSSNLCFHKVLANSLGIFDGLILQILTHCHQKNRREWLDSECPKNAKIVQYQSWESQKKQKN